MPDRPRPPYYAVIFTSQRAADDGDGYGAMADRMVELASQRPGFLGIESVRDANGLGITVSYWRDRESIRAWRDDAEHRVAQANGRARWYAEFDLRICLVEEARHFDATQTRARPIAQEADARQTSVD
jgi:heme-degrading monooxygenase HmoA